MIKADQLADTAVAVSVTTFLGLTLGEWDHLVHICAGVVAIASGVAAMIYYIRKSRGIKRKDE